MASQDSATAKPPKVWAFGPLPPPVTGMSLLTEKVVRTLQERMPLTIANFSAGDDRPRAHTRLLRLLLSLGCVVKLVLHGRVRNARLYLCANSRGGGLLTTGLLVKTARRMGYSIHLHHHVYMYIDEYDRKMAWVNDSMSAGDVHLMHSPQMIEDFRARYPSKAKFEFLYPSVVALRLSQPRQQMPSEFRLGFLANLTLAKGLDLVLDTFRLLHERRANVRLSLAGPCATPEAQRLVDEAVNRYGGLVTCWGPVFDERKVDFFNSIDCFVFPSRTEAWPIVLNESLASGVPVIATNRGCIRTCVGDQAGVVVDDATRYVVEAARQVEEWIDSPDRYFAASRAAIEQAARFQRESERQLQELVTRICEPTKSVRR